MVSLMQDGEMLEEMDGHVYVDLGGNSSARLEAMSYSDPDLMDGDTNFKAWKLTDDSAEGVNIGDGYWFRVDVRWLDGGAGSAAGWTAPSGPVPDGWRRAAVSSAPGIAPSSPGVGGTVYARGDSGANAPGPPLVFFLVAAGFQQHPATVSEGVTVMNVARSIFMRKGYLLTALAVAVLLAGSSRGRRGRRRGRRLQQPQGLVVPQERCKRAQMMGPSTPAPLEVTITRRTRSKNDPYNNPIRPPPAMNISYFNLSTTATLVLPTWGHRLRQDDSPFATQPNKRNRRRYSLRQIGHDSRLEKTTVPISRGGQPTHKRIHPWNVLLRSLKPKSC